MSQPHPIPCPKNPMCVHQNQPEIRGVAHPQFYVLQRHIDPLCAAILAGIASRCASRTAQRHINPLREFRVGGKQAKRTPADRGILFRWVDAKLLEQLLRENGQIDAPVAPDVAAVGFVIFAGIAVGFAVVFKDQRVTLDTVIFADTDPEELGLGSELGGEFRVIVPVRNGDA